MSTAHPTIHWHALDDGRVQCDVCPRHCRLAEGQRGLCFVRANEDGQVVLTTYGRSSGYCIDPIEKKPLNHFLPGTPVLSFGTAGCNLTCTFCQNWDISKSRVMDTLQDEAPPALIAKAANALGCRSVAFTYNDPVIFLEYALDTADACHAHGVRTVAVTAGYIAPQARRDFFAKMDAANIDLKAFTEGFYKRLCTAELGAVLETLEYVHHETDTWMEITTLLIPEANDSDREITALCEWVVDRLGVDVPLHFSAFHPDFRMKDRGRTPESTLQRARRIAKSTGIRHVYTGNVHDPAGQSTYCHVCGEVLVGRDWYVLSDWGLDIAGRCRHCKTPLPGHFEALPGQWGARRQRVRLSDFAAT